MADTVIKNEKALKLKFTLDNDKNHMLNLKDPKDNLTLSDVMNFGATMVAKEAIIVGGSPIASLADCYIETTNITRTELA